MFHMGRMYLLRSPVHPPELVFGKRLTRNRTRAARRAVELLPGLLLLEGGKVEAHVEEISPWGNRGGGNIGGPVANGTKPHRPVEPHLFLTRLNKTHLDQWTPIYFFKPGSPNKDTYGRTSELRFVGQMMP